MNILRVLKYLILKIDLFGSSEFLRYKGQSRYQTLTGGIITLILIVVFSIVLFQSLDSVVGMRVVSAKDALYFEDEPSITSFKFSEAKFIFGIGLSNFNLNDKFRYFDIALSAETFNYGKKTEEIEYPLQPCEESQWANVNDIGKNSYHKIHLDQYLCPKPDMTVELTGKYTSEIFKVVKIKVSKCKNNTDFSRPCASDDLIARVSFFALNFYFMNAYVNSGNQEPVSYYLQDRNYFPFSINSTIVNNIYLSEHIISTDKSLLPNEDIENQTVLLVRQLAEVKSSLKQADQYIDVYLRKSTQLIKSTRNFEKIDELLSYIGGLFGFAIAFFFIMLFYTEAAYEIQMGDKLFFYSSTTPLETSKFNFLNFIGLSFYDILKKMNIQIPWIKMEQYYKCKQEVNEQLDLALLMNKITFLEKCMNILFQQHQFRAIYLQQKPTVAEAEALRENHGLNQIIHKKSRQINAKIQFKAKKESLKEIQRTISSKKFISMRNLKNEDRQNKNQQNEKREENHQQIPYELMDIVSALILRKETESESSEKKVKIEKTESIQSRYQDINNLELEIVATENRDSLKYINVALNDIRLIERQASEGNITSKKIYERLNTQITKEQFLILQCLQRISSEKKIVSDSLPRKKDLQCQGQPTPSIFAQLMKTVDKNTMEEHQQQYQKGFQLILQTNHHLTSNQYI